MKTMLLQLPGASSNLAPTPAEKDPSKPNKWISPNGRKNREEARRRTTPHELKRSPTVLERHDTGKEKERSSADNYLTREVNKILKSLFYSIEAHTTGPSGSGKRRYTSSQVSRARFRQDEPEAAPSHELHLYPSQSRSPVRVTALAPFCSQSPGLSEKGAGLISGGGGGNDGSNEDLFQEEP